MCQPLLVVEKCMISNNGFNHVTLLTKLLKTERKAYHDTCYRKNFQLRKMVATSDRKSCELLLVHLLC